MSQHRYFVLYENVPLPDCHLGFDVLAALNDLSETEAGLLLEALQEKAGEYYSRYLSIEKDNGSPKSLVNRVQAEKARDALRTANDLAAEVKYELALLAVQVADHLRADRSATGSPPGPSEIEGRGGDATPTKQDSRLLVDIEKSQITLDGQVFCNIQQDAVLLVKTLLDAKGEYVAGHRMDMRVDRVKQKLPDLILALIEAASGKGHRIPLSKLG